MEAFILMKSQQFIFAFVSLAFGDVSWKRLLWPMSKRLLPMFSLYDFDRFLSHTEVFHPFRVYLCVWCERMIEFYSSVYSCQIFPAPFIKGTVFFPLDVLSHFVKDWLTMELRVCFWVLYSVPLIDVSIFVPYHTVLMIRAL